MHWFLEAPASEVMSLPDGPLPLKLDPLPGESGLGYCLRTVHKNGANLQALRGLLRVGSGAQLSRTHARSLAAIFQISVSWLERRLPDKHGIANKERNYDGHVFYAYNHLRFKHPQVCPHCIRQRGCCNAVWDLAMGTVCLEHDCTLIDCCQKCGQALRWDRPSIEVSHCGHYIQPSVRSKNVASELVEWQRFLEEKFTQVPSKRIQAAQTWTGLLQPMSLGGAFILIAAFGCIERPFMPIHTRQCIKNNSPEEWQTMVLRAVQRFEELCCEAPDERVLSSVVAQPTLMRLMQVPGDSADLQIALSLLDRIFAMRPDRRMLGQYPNMGQLKLF